MNRASFVLSFLLAVAYPFSLSAETAKGAWLINSLTWSTLDGDSDPMSQTAEAEILYFGENHKFGLIRCYLIRTAKGKINISHGDPREVLLGEWTRRGSDLHISFRLTEATVRSKDTVLPGPMTHASASFSNNGFLVFDGKTFRRIRELDLTAADAVYFQRLDGRK